MVAVVLAIATAAAYVASSLFALRTAWSVALAILMLGGAIATCAVVLRNAPRPPARRARGLVPRDPGIPKPGGAPYRGS